MGLENFFLSGPAFQILGSCGMRDNWNKPLVPIRFLIKFCSFLQCALVRLRVEYITKELNN